MRSRRPIAAGMLGSDSQPDYHEHCSEAVESPTSQFNNGGSTGRSECDRIQVGSEGNTKVMVKMEIEKIEGMEDEDATARRKKAGGSRSLLEYPCKIWRQLQDFQSLRAAIESEDFTQARWTRTRQTCR